MQNIIMEQKNQKTQKFLLDICFQKDVIQYLRDPCKTRHSEFHEVK